MNLKRGQRVLYAPKASTFGGTPQPPEFLTVGKVDGRYNQVHMKSYSQPVGSRYTMDCLDKEIICIDGSDNEQKHAMEAAKQYHEELEAEIKAARDKYKSRIADLIKQHRGDDE